MSTVGSIGCLPFSKRNKPMKRLILTAAIILATTSTPAFTQNTEQENNAAMAAVIYMIAQKRCNLTTGEDGKLRGMTISVIESHGYTAAPAFADEVGVRVGPVGAGATVGESHEY